MAVAGVGGGGGGALAATSAAAVGRGGTPAAAHGPLPHEGQAVTAAASGGSRRVPPLATLTSLSSVGQVAWKEADGTN